MENTAGQKPIRVLVTGANGKIAYTLIPHLLSGAVFGADQTIILHLLGRRENVLRGLAMEIEDCVFPLHGGAIRAPVIRDWYRLINEPRPVRRVISPENISGDDITATIGGGTVATSDVSVAFRNVDVAVLLASVPRRSTLNRVDLRTENFHIIHNHGRALAKYAKHSVKVVVVTNPCNTMAYVCREAAPSLPDSAFTCLTLIDSNRASYQVQRLVGDARRASNLIILGNHSEKVSVDLSKTQVVLTDGTGTRKLETSESEAKRIQQAVQGRGIEIIKLTGETTVLSATAALVDHLRKWWLGTSQGEWTTMGVASDGSYGVPTGLFSSFPVTVSKEREISIVQSLPLSVSTKHTLTESVEELLSEIRATESTQRTTDVTATHVVEMRRL